MIVGTSLLPGRLLAATAGSGVLDNQIFGRGARALGLGRSVVSSTRGAESLFNNPAGLVDVENQDILVSYASLISDVQYLQLSTALPINGQHWGMGLLNAGVSGLDYTTTSNLILGSFDYNSFVFYLSYADQTGQIADWTLPRALNWGLNAKYFYQGFGELIGQGRGSGVDMDLGLQMDVAKDTRA